MALALKSGEPAGEAGAEKSRSKTKRKPSAIEKLSPDEVKTLRLDDGSHLELDALSRQLAASRDALLPFENEDAGDMTDARYTELTAAQEIRSKAAIAIVHFMAPRILKLREGEAKRFWRSFLTRFRKEEQLG